MDKQVEMLLGTPAAVLAVGAYRRERRRRALRVEASARKYLSGQYGELPKNLPVNCSDDALRVWERPALPSLHSETADSP